MIANRFEFYVDGWFFAVVCQKAGVSQFSPVAKDMFPVQYASKVAEQLLYRAKSDARLKFQDDEFIKRYPNWNALNASVAFWG